MSNFEFLKRSVPELYEGAYRAEAYLGNDSPTAYFYARRAIENLAHYIYRVRNLPMPYQATLNYAGYLVRVRFKDPDYANFVAGFLNSDYGKGLRRKMAKAAVNQANINAKELSLVKIPGDIKNIKIFVKKLKSIRGFLNV